MWWSRVNPEYSIHHVQAYTEYKHTPSTSIHPVQHTPNTAYTEYSMNRILHHPKIDCLPLPASLSSLGRPCCTQFTTFLQFRVNQWIESQLPSRLPTELYRLQIDRPQVLLQSPLIMASKCISTLARSHPPSVSLYSLNHNLQVHLQTRSITASMCITKLARLLPRSSHDHGLQVNLHTHSITASKYIFKERCRVYGDTGVTEVDRVMGSIYSADPGVDRYHLISISSYHTMKIQTLSVPTFDLTRSDSNGSG